MLWSDLRAEVRGGLGEETLAAISQYSDSIMLVAVNRGLRQIGNLLPLPASSGVPAVLDQEEYDLPSTCLSVLACEYPTSYLRRRGTIPTLRATVWGLPPGMRTTVRTSAVLRYFVDDRLHLVPAPSTDDLALSSDITVYYHRMRDPVSADSDTVDCLYDEVNLLQEWIKADMMAAKLGPDAFLSRWKARGTRDDSPIIPAHKTFYRMFNEMVDQVKHSRAEPILTLAPKSYRGRMYGRRNAR